MSMLTVFQAQPFANQHILLARLVPRCSDPCMEVRQLSMDCLQTTLLLAQRCAGECENWFIVVISWVCDMWTLWSRRFFVLKLEPMDGPRRVLSCLFCFHCLLLRNKGSTYLIGICLQELLLSFYFKVNVYMLIKWFGLFCFLSILYQIYFVNWYSISQRKHMISCIAPNPQVIVSCTAAVAQW